MEWFRAPYVHVQQKHQWFDIAIVLDYSPNLIHIVSY
jgi:hypothetical protein